MAYKIFFGGVRSLDNKCNDMINGGLKEKRLDKQGNVLVSLV
jgi:hypothetical protein